jgi:hypothetical protein
VLGGQPLDQCVGVLGIAHLERSQVAILPHAVEDDDAARTAHGHEARELIGQLADVLEPARVQKVVAVEEVERRLGH